MLLKTSFMMKIFGFLMLVMKRIPENVIYLASVSLAILAWYLDFIKDIIIAADLSHNFEFMSEIKREIVVALWITVFLRNDF